MDPSSEDWQRLAQYVIRRRTSLGLTQQDVRAAGGPSTATIRLIEAARATSYRPLILRGLEKALRWKEGSIDAILGGREPNGLDEVIADRGQNALHWQERAEQAEARIARLRRMAQVWIDMRPDYPTATREGHGIAYAGEQIVAAIDEPASP